MDEFRLIIQLKNAAFEDSPNIEVVRILRQLADRIETHNYLDANNDYPLYDYNGNEVGNAGVYNH